jgi:hypothetical protein
MKIDDTSRSFERVEEFKYYGTTLTNQNSIRKNLRADCSEVVVTTIRCRMFSVPVYYQKI